MRCNADDPGSAELCEALVLELFGDSPRNQIAGGPEATLHVVLQTVLVDLALEAYLYCAKDVWQQALLLLSVGQRSGEDEDLMGRRVREKL